MESFYLLHLAAHGTRIRAATCAIVAANRGTGAVVEKDAFEAVEARAGRAVLRTVVALPADVPPPAPAPRETGAELGSALRAMQIGPGGEAPRMGPEGGPADRDFRGRPSDRPYGR